MVYWITFIGNIYKYLIRKYKFKSIGNEKNIYRKIQLLTNLLIKIVRTLKFENLNSLKYRKHIKTFKRSFNIIKEKNIFFKNTIHFI